MPVTTKITSRDKKTKISKHDNTEKSWKIYGIPTNC